jgi:hypothetical protein
MSRPTTPEERAQALVTVAARVPGGPWFIALRELVEPPVLLGPYESPAVAREDAGKIRQFVAALLRQAGQASPPG